VWGVPGYCFLSSTGFTANVPPPPVLLQQSGRSLADAAAPEAVVFGIRIKSLEASGNGTGSIAALLDMLNS
jgi:hypothetical protein